MWPSLVISRYSVQLLVVGSIKCTDGNLQSVSTFLEQITPHIPNFNHLDCITEVYIWHRPFMLIIHFLQLVAMNYSDLPENDSIGSTGASFK